jgi:hypothetical protein
VSREMDEELLCPSARCEEGAILLGVVGPNSRVGFIRPRITVDQDFVEAARGGRAPEKRFRFAQPCIEDGCRHWQSGRCHVADVAAAREEAVERPLPACSIRPSCRWFAQSGAAACAACPYVVTDVNGALAHRADATVAS